MALVVHTRMLQISPLLLSSLQLSPLLLVF
jgi:hypothetical protein